MHFTSARKAIRYNVNMVLVRLSKNVKNHFRLKSRRIVQNHKAQLDLCNSCKTKCRYTNYNEQGIK